MKKLIFLIIFCVLASSAFSQNITIAPGDTVEVFSQLSDGDSIFIQGGTGDVTLDAGDGEFYQWNICSTSGTNRYFTFNYGIAENDLGNQIKGCYVNSRKEIMMVIGIRNIYIGYKLDIEIPSTPSGQIEVCVGSTNNYSTTSVDPMDAYVWTLSPIESGTLNSSTSTVTTVENNVDIQFNWTFIGNASLSVKGIKDGVMGPSSDPLNINVGTIPAKPYIDGYILVDRDEEHIYSTQSNYPSYIWTISPSEIVNIIQNGSQVNVNFLDTGNFVVNLAVGNNCGSNTSDNFNVKVVALNYFRQLKKTNNILGNRVDSLVIAKDSLIIAKDSLTTQLSNLSTVLDSVFVVNDSLVQSLDSTMLVNQNLGMILDSVIVLNDSLVQSLDSTMLVNQNLGMILDSVIVLNDSLSVLLDTLSYVYSISWDIQQIITTIEEVTVDLDISVYPNPSYDKIYIKSGQEIELIKIFNSSGTQLINNHVNGNEAYINKYDLSTGVYIMQIFTKDSGVISRKIIFK